MNDELDKFKKIKDATTTCLNINPRFPNQIRNPKASGKIPASRFLQGGNPVPTPASGSTSG
ncbi:hypothetical protein F2Q70_00011665 [Brassica cretica]|uniref:Uncharacterized protein n=1 Tax=Brassica cretica TaxID=69181 RepID=A0A3N6S222_BRACR|nr:hypothetical protein F2Q70_00011665 [Brassica cretica]KAF3542711.1 hypothetical protein DY000_02007067 [Brassica cretica]